MLIAITLQLEKGNLNLEVAGQTIMGESFTMNYLGTLMFHLHSLIYEIPVS
jgi:predicted amino acid-binding ACT domain protein